MLCRQLASEISILWTEFRLRISVSGFNVASAVLRTFREFVKVFLLPLQSKLRNQIMYKNFDEKTNRT